MDSVVKPIEFNRKSTVQVPGTSPHWGWPVFALMLYFCENVKIQFDNTSTCKYSIILALRSVAMLDCAFRPPYLEILDPPLSLV